MPDKKSFMQIALTPTRDFAGPPVPIVPFADWDYYYLTEKLEWRSDIDQLKTITAPKGFVTDLASVPHIFWSLLPPTARYSYPAVIHDFLYWFQPCERGVADNVLKEAMQDMRVASAQIFTIYNAVSVAGGAAWAANAAARAKGERRILKTFPTEFKTTWASWRERPDVFLDSGG